MSTEAGECPISFQDLLAYADRFGFSKTSEDLKRFIALIQACDNAYLNQAAKKRKKEIDAIIRKT